MYSVCSVGNKSDFSCNFVHFVDQNSVVLYYLYDHRIVAHETHELHEKTTQHNHPSNWPTEYTENRTVSKL